MNNSLLKPKQLVIIGSGVSLKEGIEKGLWEKLKGKWTIGLNYSYNFFDSTMLCYVDNPFYKEESKKEKFQKLPLIVGKEHNQLKTLPNTITLKTNDAKYYRDVKLGIYKSNLCGLFALSLAIYLLDEGTIFLLGYDNCAMGKAKDGRALTHFYQGQINHRGIGKINYFNGIHKKNKKSKEPGKKFVDRDFDVYKDEKKVKIYNVSVMSKINTFIKGGYGFFFENLDKQEYDQDQIREYVKGKLK